MVHDYLAASPSASLTFRPSLAHRIDRDTSGIVLVGKTKVALDSLTKQFREGKVKKRYLAVCLGTPSEPSGTIRHPLSRTENTHGGATVTVDANGQDAVTRYRVLASGIHDRYSLVECLPETGRTHQIRVHLQTLGHPILGDRTYGDTHANTYAKRTHRIDRHLLHAESVSLLHPVKRVTVTYRARLREDMESLLAGVASEGYRGKSV